MDIKVSIIVPIYNKEKYLKDCLDTIISQTLKEIEIILVDDGSTDTSKQICDEYLSDSRVSYIYQENEGLASARQTGMDVAKGEYIGFIDADDWIDNTMYEVMYSVAKKHDLDVVYINRMDGENGHRVTPETTPGLYDRDHIKSDILPKTLAFIGDNGQKRSISPSNCRRIYRKKLLDDNHIRFDRRFRRSQDMMLTYEAMLHAQSFYYLGNEYLYHTRVVGDSLSRGYTRNLLKLYVPLIERLYKDTEQYPELNLMDSMHLRAFFYITDCIENEFKYDFPYDEKKRLELIDEIVNHPLCERYYGNIEIEKMAPLYQKYYELIHKKDAKGIIRYTKAYRNKQRRKAKYYSPIVDFITEGPGIGRIYKKLRHKG